MPAARWLNEQGLRMNRNRECGGNRKRMGFFTIGNLQPMIRNKMYVGIKSYNQDGQVKETEAVWAPIVDRETFDMANELLSKHKKLTKVDEEGKNSRYPYILSPVISCKVCGDRLSGKSAHGKREKIGYYEHAWATRKGSHVPGLKHRCWPYRVLAKEIEPAVWQEITKVLTNDDVAKDLMNEAVKSFRLNPGSREAERHRQTVFSVDEKLETLSERLASLPSSVSPTPIYKQMEKLEALKKEAELKLRQLESGGVAVGMPIELKSYEVFRERLRDFLKGNPVPEAKATIARYLIRWIKVHPDGFDINWALGDSYVKCVLASWSDSKNSEKSDGLKAKKRAEGFAFSPTPAPEGVGCSNTVDIGRGGGI